MASQVALGLAAWGRPITAAVILLVVWVRFRGRWLYRWLTIAIRYGARRRTLPADGDLLTWVAPDTRLAWVAPDTRPETEQPAAYIEDSRGWTVPLELDDPSSPLPPFAELAGPDTTVQLVVARVGHRQRVLLAVRAPTVTELNAAVRRIQKHCMARPLADPRVLAELAHHDGGWAARERWDGLHLGGLFQVGYRVEPAHAALVPRLLALPATATLVTIATDHLALWLAAPTPGALAAAERALHHLTPGARRRDGEHLPALADTLPLGRHHSGQTNIALDRPRLTIGVDRHGDPVVVPLLRHRPTRVLVAGDRRLAHLVTSQTTETDLVVRDRLTPADLDALAGADLLVLPPLTEAEAALVAEARGLGRGSEWFTRIRGDMVAVVAGRTIRWARTGPNHARA